MFRIVAAIVLTAFFASACNTMDGLVTDVDHGVSKLKGDDRNR
jgi:predicted small secreted protein